MSATSTPAPTHIDQASSTEMRIRWNTDEEFRIPFVEMRFQCPCAHCVDEHTGKRTIRRESVDPAIKPKEVQLVGRYAIQIAWSDGHNTGIYPFDRLYWLSEKYGKR